MPPAKQAIACGAICRRSMGFQPMNHRQDADATTVLIADCTEVVARLTCPTGQLHSQATGGETRMAAAQETEALAKSTCDVHGDDSHDEETCGP